MIGGPDDDNDDGEGEREVKKVRFASVLRDDGDDLGRRNEQRCSSSSSRRRFGVREENNEAGFDLRASERRRLSLQSFSLSLSTTSLLLSREKLAKRSVKGKPRICELKQLKCSLSDVDSPFTTLVQL